MRVEPTTADAKIIPEPRQQDCLNFHLNDGITERLKAFCIQMDSLQFSQISHSDFSFFSILFTFVSLREKYERSGTWLNSTPILRKLVFKRLSSVWKACSLAEVAFGCEAGFAISAIERCNPALDESMFHELQSILFRRVRHAQFNSIFRFHYYYYYDRAISSHETYQQI